MTNSAPWTTLRLFRARSLDELLSATLDRHLASVSTRAGLGIRLEVWVVKSPAGSDVSVSKTVAIFRSKHHEDDIC